MLPLYVKRINSYMVEFRQTLQYLQSLDWSSNPLLPRMLTMTPMTLIKTRVKNMWCSLSKASVMWAMMTLKVNPKCVSEQYQTTHRTQRLKLVEQNGACHTCQVSITALKWYIERRGLQRVGTTDTQFAAPSSCYATGAKDCLLQSMWTARQSYQSIVCQLP